MRRTSRKSFTLIEMLACQPKPRPAGRRQSQRAFTLIEMLVIMGIIGILLALILPGVGRARERGRRARCLGNLRQIGYGVRMYLDDNGAQFPQVTDDQWNNNGFGWISETYYFEYVNNEYGVFRCPSQQRNLVTERPDGYKFAFPSASNHWVTYEYNHAMCWANSNTAKVANRRFIAMPSVCAYAWDWPHYLVNGTEDWGPHKTAEGLNVLYMDYHVAWLPYEMILDGTTNVFHTQGFAD